MAKFFQNFCPNFLENLTKCQKKKIFEKISKFFENFWFMGISRRETPLSVIVVKKIRKKKNLCKFD